MAIKQPIGIDSRIGVRMAMPGNPNLFLIFTQRRDFLEKTFLGFFRLNNPVFLLNQFQKLRSPELKNIKTIIPKVPDRIPNPTDGQNDNFSLRIKNGTVIANLKDAISIATITSSQVVSIITSLHRLDRLHLQALE